MTKAMKELTSLNILSVAKFQGIITLVIGFLVGIFTLIGSIFSGPVTFLDGLFMILFMVVLYGIVGFLGGLVGAFVYNKVAKKFGGVKFSMK